MISLIMCTVIIGVLVFGGTCWFAICDEVEEPTHPISPENTTNPVHAII